MDSTMINRPWPSLLLLLLCSLSTVSLSSSPLRHLLQSSSPQNIQNTPSSSVPTSSTPPPNKNSESRKIAIAVVATAACSFAVSGLIFFVFHRLSAKRRRTDPSLPFTGPIHPFRTNPDATFNSVIVEEEVPGIKYWRDLDSTAAPLICDRCKSLLKGSPEEEGDVLLAEKHQRQRRNGHGSQEIPLLPSDYVDSSSFVSPLRSIGDAPPPQKSPQLPPPAPPPPPPPPPSASPPSPPPPAPPAKKSPAPPPPPPGRRAAAAPPPPRSSSKKPPPVPENVKDRPRLKPLHWDKVTPANAGQSMVWDKITDGSIGFDDDLMEALFGYVPNSKPSSYKPGESSAGRSSTSTTGAAAVPAQIFLLEPRKSQNIAIVLRTLAVSRQEIIDGLIDGHDLAADTLEKLSRIAPTPEEESLILSFSGDPFRLADAESFLLQILRSVPSAFPRIASLHFRRSNYEPEILNLKQTLEILELACRELRTRGLFLKLLEAILKAGNRMNAGTARGNAQAFDLTALCKLSDVKSTDGKTTLLHFVVEEVVRSEGKHCATITRSQSIRLSGSKNAGCVGEIDVPRQAREERKWEYMTLGLPIVAALSVEFTNVKKAAGIDHDSLAGCCSALAMRVEGIREVIRSWKAEEGGFVMEMTEFVEQAVGEIEKVKEEQGRVMEMVKRTTEYYQPGASKDKAAQPLQLFVIVRNFLAMVDQACADISKNLQKKKPAASLASTSTAAPTDGAGGRSPAVLSLAYLKENRITTRFPNLPARFMSDNSSISSSDSEEDEF